MKTGNIVYRLKKLLRERHHHLSPMNEQTIGQRMRIINKIRLFYILLYNKYLTSRKCRIGNDIETMKLIVEDAVNIYNSLRPHWSCFMNTPEQMHQQKDIEIKTYKKSESSKLNLATL